MKKVKVAAAQLAPVYFDRDKSLAKACAAIEEAAAHGAELIAFPESFLPGYPYFAMFLPPTAINAHLRTLYREAVQIPSPATDTLCAAAKRANMHVVMGLHERDGGTLYNGQLFIGPDGVVLGRRRKLVPTSFERMVWGRGDGSDLAVFDTKLGVLGGLICYEHSNALFRYALQAQREQIHIANWPGGMPSINSIIDATTRSYAFEAQAFVISVTSVFTEEALSAFDNDVRDKLQQGGGYSSIVAPRGDYLAGPALDGEQILYAELDFQLIDNLKAIVDSAGHYARPDVVQLKLERDRQNVIDDRSPSVASKPRT
jgi:aliphatic nitrilase